MGEAATHPRHHVEPVEEGPGQNDLMKRVGAQRSERLVGAAGGKAAPVITEGTVALVIKRRSPDLLAPAREFDVRQTLDRLEETVNARLGQQVQTEIGPGLVGF